MVFTTLLLLVVLFLAAFFIYFPNRKLLAWFQSFFPVETASDSTATKKEVAKNVRSVITTRREEDPELKRVFATFDKNSDGFITKQELKESLKNIRVFMSDEEVEEMVNKVDANGDGLIDFSEFCLLCQGQSIVNGGEDGNEAGEVDQEEELREAFGVFDKDKDGLISVEELGVVLCSLGLREGNRVEACKEMVKKVDKDGDGMVNFDEFKMMMKGGRLLTAF
ncbi:calmodulin-like protein 3 [Rosa rugosa]|uniref:calmodulin-like protein 3 n=1 Tax=Rosa rugosa TaxID=74645 RepID=UPI002B410E89|nr:calmodulin-like protein 3 [Rosa rugosa]